MNPNRIVRVFFGVWVLFFYSLVADAVIKFSDAKKIPAPQNVKEILENHCIICHMDTSANFGRLNLSDWATINGKPTFVELYSNGEQRPAEEVFENIIDRITTTDKNNKMPLGYQLKDETEFKPLMEWLSGF